MTLQEKILNKFPFTNTEYIREYEQIADDFAIGFAEWVQNNCDEFPRADQRLLLQIYKKEKGL